jgi:hypothetical protein
LPSQQLGEASQVGYFDLHGRQLWMVEQGRGGRCGSFMRTAQQFAKASDFPTTTVQRFR